MSSKATIRRICLDAIDACPRDERWQWKIGMWAYDEEVDANDVSAKDYDGDRGRWP